MSRRSSGKPVCGKRLGLTQAAVAEAMGITRRAVIYYEQGARLIPKVVTLACKALEAERTA
ncbi:helix-turn-helix transcriptional regulator [Fundidesulfovibrio magnetotacticus]|uniref:helix-turn-helix transcriptional regulator n=1 Tax=Fundidesulfovibrio magnetotacticus TaxID=2730080 RepID=UPI0027E46F32|nr:helix-turn-helix transcriptional regulator [Fundidesulfovibrio magnetotacticus]